jgi:enamine deaminase RidA (YjgF/YER057c/UK114 family)
VTLRRINPETLVYPSGYSQVVVAEGEGRMVFVAGQVSVDAEGALVAPGDPVGQAEQAYRNLRMALHGAGATSDDVVKLTTFVVGLNPELRAAIGAARTTVFGESRPASTLLGVVALADPAYLVEVEATAVVFHTELDL